MSLADRLNDSNPARSNVGCVTCEWLDTLTAEDRAAFTAWLEQGNSMAQLWEICCQDGLKISLTGFRNHLKHHGPR